MTSYFHTTDCMHAHYPIMNPSPYKVSTITATCKVGSAVDLAKLFDLVDVVDGSDEEGVTYIEYGQKRGATWSKGYHKKLKKASDNPRRFDNQTTLVMKMKNELTVNTKLFKNGNVQMTGLKEVEQGQRVLSFLVDILRTKAIDAVTTPENLDSSGGIQVCLINCDFNLGVHIRRDRLCRVIQTTTDVFCMYEPCIYPGVKIQYLYNTSTPDSGGVCKCPDSVDCRGKGTGHGEGQCKRITIAAFQSGSVIITGAVTNKQIECAYDFICDVVKKNMDNIRRPIHLPIPSK